MIFRLTVATSDRSSSVEPKSVEYHAPPSSSLAALTGMCNVNLPFGSFVLSTDVEEAVWCAIGCSSTMFDDRKRVVTRNTLIE